MSEFEPIMVEMTITDVIRLAGLKAIIESLDYDTVEADLIDALGGDVKSEVALIAGKERIDSISRVWENDPDPLSPMDQTKAAALASWLEGFIVGAQFQRIMLNGNTDLAELYQKVKRGNA